MIPELAFDGGRLRSWQEADAPRLVEAWADEAVARWNPVPPEPTLATALRWIGGVADRATQRISLDWVIESLDGEVVGEVGLSGFSERHTGAMIGYWLLPDGRGRGFASLAVAAVTSWARETPDLEVLVARCDAANLASQRVAERAGYHLERSDSTGHQLWVSPST